jgi:ribosomal protein L16
LVIQKSEILSKWEILFNKLENLYFIKLICYVKSKEQNIEYHRGTYAVQKLVVMKFFGSYGLQALEPTDYITSNWSISSSNYSLTQNVRLHWIRIFPDKTVTARAAESRMGSGKGSVDYWVVL